MPKDSKIVKNGVALAMATTLVFATIPVAPSTAQAETWNHRAYATIGNSGKSKFVQGATYDGNRYAYVVKQNVSKHQTLWRADMRTGGKAVKLSLTKYARKAVHHGNGMSYFKMAGKDYLLVAPCRKKSNKLVMLKVKGKKVSYVRSIPMKFTDKVSCVAVKSVKGKTVTAFVGKNSKLWLTSFRVDGKSVKTAKRVYGYKSNQDIGYHDGMLYAVDGGYKTRLGNVRKYRVVKSGGKYTLRKEWVRQIKGEPESVFVADGKVCVALEGKWHWNFSDRIVKWVR